MGLVLRRRNGTEKNALLLILLLLLLLLLLFIAVSEEVRWGSCPPFAPPSPRLRYVEEYVIVYSVPYLSANVSCRVLYTVRLAERRVASEAVLMGTEISRGTGVGTTSRINKVDNFWDRGISLQSNESVCCQTTVLTREQPRTETRLFAL